MELKYRFDPERLEIRETAGDADVEFEITFLQKEPMLEKMRDVQKRFEENDVYTDVLFYMNEGRVQQFKVVVRKDFYLDFILALLKHQLLTRVEWT